MFYLLVLLPDPSKVCWCVLCCGVNGAFIPLNSAVYVPKQHPGVRMVFYMENKPSNQASQAILCF